MLAYYLAWHLRQAWAPLLFNDEQPPDRRRPRRQGRPLTRRRSARPRPSAPPPASPATATAACSPSSRPLTRNTIRLPGATATFDKLTEPTPLQARALDLADARARHHVVTNQTAPSTPKPRRQAKLLTPPQGTTG